MEYTHMENIYSFDFLAFILAGILFLLLLFSLALVENFKEFIEERRYLKMEIKNSGNSTVRYWKRELRWLYITHIPFLGSILRKLRRK